jgi:hypothetical protein
MKILAKKEICLDVMAFFQGAGAALFKRDFPHCLAPRGAGPRNPLWGAGKKTSKMFDTPPRKIVLI